MKERKIIKKKTNLPKKIIYIFITFQKLHLTLGERRHVEWNMHN